MESETELNSKAKVVEIAGKMVSLLEPLTSEERRNVIAGSMALLGENYTPVGAAQPTRNSAQYNPDSSSEGLPSAISAKASNWVRQNGLTAGQLEQVFEIGASGVPVIASRVPGANKKAQSLNAYVIYGLSRLLATGEAVFQDKDARALCESLGCYDPSNHSNTLANKGNLFSGNKSDGWRLTSPGLARGAQLVTELSRT
jgi:hypothetical protein